MLNITKNRMMKIMRHNAALSEDDYPQWDGNHTNKRKCLKFSSIRKYEKICQVDDDV